MDEKKIINEFFAVPTGLFEVYEEDGVKFYSSRNLQASFIKAITKSSRTRKVSKEINNLVKRNIIVPCFKSKNLISFLKRKVSRNVEKSILAYYTRDGGKVIIIIDHNVSLFGTASNDELASTTLHECMHLSAGKKTTKFLSIFKPYLTSFYKEFFDIFFECDSSDKDIQKVILKIYHFERNRVLFTNRQLSNYYKFLEDLFITKSRLAEKDFKLRLTKLIVALKLLVSSLPTLLKNVRYYGIVFTTLNRAYENAFKKRNNYSLPIQELILISEVASIYSEMHPTNPVIKKLVQII